MKDFYDKKSLIRELRKFIFLNILAMSAISCYILADTFFISRAAGNDGITALNIVLPIYAVIFALGAMIGIGSATRYAIEKACGSKNYDYYFGTAISFALAISVIFIIVGVFFPDRVMMLMGADISITKVGESYTRTFMLCAPFFLTNYTFTSFVRNDNAPGLAMAATVISSLSNIILDYVFMFPLKMGITGAALATGISPFISIVISSIHFLGRNNSIRFKFNPKIAFKLFFASCALGLSSFMGEIASGITTTTFNLVLLKLSGNTAVAAYAIMANTALVCVALFNGIASGLQPVASACFGRGEHANMRITLKYAMKITIIIEILTITLIMLLSDYIIAIFNRDHDAILASMASKGIKLYFLGLIFAGINIVLSGYLSATKRPLSAFTISILRGAIIIVIAAITLGNIFGINGVWLAFTVSEAISFLISLMLLVRYKKK